MKVSKDGNAIYAEVIEHSRRSGNSFYLLRYVTEKMGMFYFIEIPVTIKNRHLKKGDKIEMQMFILVDDYIEEPEDAYKMRKEDY